MPKLQLENVQKSYGSNSVLNEISLELNSPNGMIVGVVGKNGAGKSTLFKILSSIDKDYTGTFNFDFDGQMKLGFLPEERSLTKLGTISDILLLWARLQGVPEAEIKGKLEYWFQRVHLWDRKDEKMSSLSKGNQQKLQLACALINDPNLIIFDEPFSGLDPSNQELVIDILAECKARGALVLLSAHQLELVERIADKCFILTNGQLESMKPDLRLCEQELLIECSEPESLEGIAAVALENNTYLLQMEQLSPNDKDKLFGLFCSNVISVAQRSSLRNVFLQKVTTG